ncbi:hypothetical protein [Alloscardovia criceti]|uniref:hypothetical protein n=1 Tax=Alloscardovia criceti TaxID=356828 RepID=UPI000382C0ED|nr:hypothetical protein [Alloscardovia criceti]
MTDSNGIPSMGNFNPNSKDDAMNESQWDIPNLDGIDFDLSGQPTAENTQSLAQLSESTSSSLREINADTPDQEGAQHVDSSTANASDNSIDPESTASFDPLADDADMLPAEFNPHTETHTISMASQAGDAGDAASSTDDGSETVVLGAPLSPVDETTVAPTTPREAISGTSASGTSAAEDTSSFDTAFTEALNQFADEDDDLGKTGEFAAASAAGRHSHVARSKTNSDRNTRRILIWGIVAVLVISLIVAVAIFWRNTANAQTHQQILAECVSSRKAAEDSSAALQKVVDDAQSATSTQSSEVDDTTVLTKVKNAVNQASASIASEKDLQSCTTELSDAQLQSITSQADEIVTNQTQYTTTINDSVSAVDSAKSNKSISSAKNDLSSKRQEAQTLYDQSAGKVSDETTRENLKKAIDEADELIAQSTKSVTATQYSAAVDTLNNTMTAVQNSMKTYEEAEAKKNREENTSGICAPYAGTYANGSTQFTLNGDCSVRYADNSSGAPSTCTFSDGSTGSCATVDNQDNPSQITWSMVCTGNGACQNANVQLSTNGGAASINVGGQSFTKQ